MVPVWQKEDVISAQFFITGDDIKDCRIGRMSDMKNPGDIRRGDNPGKGRFCSVLFPVRLEVMVLLPEFFPALFDKVMIISLVPFCSIH